MTIQLSLIYVLARIHYQDVWRPYPNTTTRQRFQYALYRALLQIQKTLWKSEIALEDLISLSRQHLRLMCSIAQFMISSGPGGCDLIFNRTAFLLIEHLSSILVSIDCIAASGMRDQILESIAIIKDVVTASSRIAERFRVKLFANTVVIKHENAGLLDLLITAKEAGERLCAGITSKFPLNHGVEAKPELIERPPKRRKHTPANDIGNDAEESDYNATLRSLDQAMGYADTHDIDTTALRISQALHEEYDETHASKLLLLTARLPCAAAIPISEADDDLHQGSRCDICGKSTSKSLWNHQHWQSAFEVISAFLKHSYLQASKDVRVITLSAVRRFANHTPITEHLHLTKSVLGQFCLQGIRSSCREVRIAAVNALPWFLRSASDINNVVSRQDRVIVLDLLKQMLDGDDAQLWESSVTALGAVAASCDDEEMNIVLLRLVECLGSTNTFMCSLARLEIRNVAQVKSIPLGELFRPFWRTIALSVIKDLQNRPQKAQQLADILSKSVDDLLLETQEETLPFLLLWKHTDTLQRIANARGHGMSICDLCMQSRNLTVILANLLIQNPTHLESTVHSILGQTSPELRKVSVSTLLKLDPVAVACELLKIASDTEGANQKKVSLCRFRS